MTRARPVPSRLFALAAGLSAVVLTAACAPARPAAPPPPDLSEVGAIDPAVRSLVDELTAAVDADRGDAARWGRLGMAFEANGLLVQAAEAYDTAVALADAEPRWRYRRAILRARRGEVEPALADLDRVIEQAPSFAPARWRQGLWRLDLGRTDDALQSFRAAAQAAPADPAGPIGIALVHLTRREDADAAAELERLLQTVPGERYALQLLGTAYRRLGREDDARFALSVGKSGEPVWADAWSDEVDQYRRGFAALLKQATQLGLERRFEEAIALLERLRAERPEDRDLQVYLGGMYASAGRVADAEAVLQPVLQTDPRHFDATMHLATGYLFAGALDRAATYAARALDLRPSSADAAKLRGVIAWQQGRNAEALRVFDDAARSDPRDPMPHLYMGMIYGQQGRYPDARGMFERALAVNPLLGDALIGVADTYAADGRFGDAQAALARAEQAEPGNPRLAAARARIESAARGAR
ncbi:MAG: tetratricopeptide repeat protein [Vicinamibacterales bacterium]